MNFNLSCKKHFKNFLTRVHKNCKGQVAIFVALIFQIVFILFALMINVGLLVHHKINLQQSTDLAAYYGAMKQAEMLNVVGHVNFQVRQAFKLLTWRYRILGTFGVIGFAEGDPSRKPTYQKIDYPIKRKYPSPPTYNSNNSVCTNVNATALELPFFCMNHYGFKDYFTPPGSTNNESLCKADCETLAGVSNSIPKMYTGDATGASQIVDVISGLNTAMKEVDNKIADECKRSGPLSLVQLAKFYLSYLQDTQNKMLFMKMILANLSQSEAEMLDLEGNHVAEGVIKTFRNNLTEANNSSISKDSEVQLFNSLSPDHGGECSYTQAGKANPPETGSSKLFAEINFGFINYFILRCQQKAMAGSPPAHNTNPKEFKIASIYADNDMSKLNADLESQLKSVYSGQAQQIIDIMTNNYYKHTVGIEKNPHCGVYYGVKASSTPIIPFLPIAKIQLNAIAFAKPFGGAIGPRHQKIWTPNSQHSEIGFNKENQTDKNLPIQKPNLTSAGSLKEMTNTILNYSNYVGDPLGLSDPRFVGMYHDMLVNRSVAKNDQRFGETNEPTAGRDVKPEVWPAYSEWDQLTVDISDPKSDLLAQGPNNSHSYMRDIEISVVAPNQFESTYYSIEPDFYNVYVKDKLGKDGVMEKLKAKAGLTGYKVYIPKDFGDNKFVTDKIPQFKNFSVRNQLEVVHSVMRGASPSNTPAASTYNFTGPHHSQGLNAVSGLYFTFVPFLPGSLLTSWTMKDLVSDDFSLITNEDTKMPFAQCIDEDSGAKIHGENGYGSIADQPDPKGGSEPLPAAPGNCITGGRTGYSVKIVGPGQLKSQDSELTIGGQGAALLNPPNEFLNF